MSSRNTLSLGRSLVFLALLLVAAVPWFAAQGTGTGAAYTWQTAVAGASQLHGVAWDGQRFVAVGDKGAVFTSADGRVWQAMPSGTVQPLAAASMGDKGLVAAGALGLLMASPNAQTWHTGTVPAIPANLNGLAFGQPAGKGLYVAVGELGTLLTSPDAQTWSAAASPVTETLHGVAWGGTTDETAFVAVGDNGSLLYSRDGKSWTASQPVPANLSAVAWGGSCFVAVGQGGAAFVSAKGLKWAPAATGTSLDLNGITWMGSRFVAVGAAGAILTSVDGNTWQAQQGPTAAWLHGVAFSGFAVVAVGDGGTVVEATTYAISGTVTLNGTSTGVAGVTVRATDGLTPVSTTTAVDGTYTLAGLSGSTPYSVTPTPADPPAQQYTFQPASTDVNIGSADVTGINFSAIPNYSVSGIVTFPAGTPTPLPAVSIAVSPSAGIFSYNDTTGAYSIAGLPAGSYTLTPSLAGYVFNPSKASVALSSSSVSQNFTAYAAVAISGTVTSACTLPADAKVTATGGGMTFSGDASGGAYSVDVAANQTYTVAASGSGFTFNPLSTSVAVGTSPVTGINFTGTGTYKITGTVIISGTSTGLGGVTVKAIGPGPTVVGTATSASNGTFTISGIPNGSYEVTGTLSGYSIDTKSSTVDCGNVSNVGLTATPAYSVSGQVLYNGTAVGVPGVSVVAGPATATTDSSGNYTLTGLVAGDYTVTPTLTGFTFTPTSSAITIATQNLTGINFTAVGTRTISGTITYVLPATGGIPNVVVTASVSGYPAGMFTAITDGSGAYSIAVPPASGITVTPSLQGYTFTPANRLVDTTAGNATADFTAPKPATYTISGTLTGFTNGTSVTVTAGAGLSATVTISGTTAYNILNVANGTYTLTLSFIPSCPAYTVSPVSIPVTVSGANQTGKNFTATKVGAPTVSSITPTSGPMSGGTLVTITGTNFVDCSATVTFGTASPVPATVLSTTQLTATTPLAATAGQVKIIVTTANGASTQTVYFTYLAAYSIKGNVYGTDGTTGVSGATVTATGGGTTVTATSGAGGAYSLDNLVNGTYTVSCTYPGLAFTSQSVTISNADRTGINFTAKTAYTLSGTITYNSAGLAGVSVSAGAGLTGSTDASGNYTIPNVPNGTYTVTPALTGYYFTPANRSVTVNGANITGVNFVASSGFTISGTVSLYNGGPGLAGVTVSAGGLLTATTGISGAYTINSVGPGTYTVTPTLVGYVFNPISAPVTVTTASVASINFVATPVFPISGLVTLGSATGKGVAGVAISAGGTLVTTTAADGTYTIKDVPASTIPYIVTPTLTGYVFTPATQSVTVSTKPVTSIDFVASSLSVVATASPTSGTAPLTVAFSSTVTGGTAPYTFDWNFGDATAHGTSASPSHTYTAGGTYAVTLTVTDLAKNVAIDSHLTITVQAPLAVTAQASTLKGFAPLAVTFTAVATGGLAPYTYTWDFGDSHTGTGSPANHTYVSAGTFTAKLTVADAKANTASASLSITVLNPPIVTAVTKIVVAGEPFRLKIMGSNFHGNCTVLIGGVAVPETKFKSSSLLIAKKGGVLKAMVPKGVPVQITVKNNDDGGVSAAFTYTR